MTELQRLDELRHRAEEALRRSISGIPSETGEKDSRLASRLSTSQIELILESETLRLKKEHIENELLQYRHLFQHAPVPYFILDKKGRILQFNKAASGHLAKEENINEQPSVYNLVAHQSLNDLKIMLNEVFQQDKEVSGIIQLVDHVGHNIDYQAILSPIRDLHKGAKKCSMMLTRFPEQENYYKSELKKKENEYHLLMSNISEGIFYTEKGVLNSVNPSLSHLLGYPEKELEGKPLWDFIHSSQQLQVKELLNSPEDSERNPSCDVKCVRSDGTIFWAELKIRNLLPGYKSFGSLSDITQRKLSENQLKDSELQLTRSNAAKDKLFSIISHDLKTPFNTLMGYTYLLMKEYSHYDEKKREAMIRSLYEVTKQTFNMLENILVWSRSQTGGIPFAPRGINITTLLRENIRLYTPTARSKNIFLALHGRTEDTHVFADAEMIQTVIRNLVTNAIKFTPEKGNVSLGLIDEGEEKITVYVKDSGVGIHPDNKEKLFLFEQNYSTRGTRDEKGTGLGLTVCKEFVEKNGGEIWVESSPGKGSTFFFTLYKKIEEVV